MPPIADAEARREADRARAARNRQRQRQEAAEADNPDRCLTTAAALTIEIPLEGDDWLRARLCELACARANGTRDLAGTGEALAAIIRDSEAVRGANHELAAAIREAEDNERLAGRRMPTGIAEALAHPGRPGKAA